MATKVMPKVYLASPYGFAEATRRFMYRTLIPVIRNSGYEILNPWELCAPEALKITQAAAIDSLSEQKAQLAVINRRLGDINEAAIRESSIVVAVLDGVDVDSGTASEVGFAYGIGKKIFGYRGDFRLSADNIGAATNLQVEHFILKSGGSISGSIQELKAAIRVSD